MTTTTLDVGTASLHSVRRTVLALGGKIVDEKATPGACGYTTLTIERDMTADTVRALTALEAADRVMRSAHRQLTEMLSTEDVTAMRVVGVRSYLGHAINDLADVPASLVKSQRLSDLIAEGARKRVNAIADVWRREETRR